MAVGIYASNLTDLGRASLDSQAEQDSNAREISNQLLRQMVANQQDRQAQAQNATANREIDSRYGYLGNQLAQAGDLARMQWNTPNATAAAQNTNNLAMAKLPWTEGLTPAQKADLDFRNQFLKLQGANGFIDPATRGKIVMDAYQNNLAAKQASDAANTAFVAAKRASIPEIQQRMDAGTDNPGFNWFGGGMYAPNAAKGASVLGTEDLSTPAGVAAAKTAESGFQPGRAFIGTKNWFVTQKIPQIAATVQASLGRDAGLVKFNPATEMFEPNVVSNPFASVSTKTLDAATASQIFQQAGGDPDKARQIARDAGYSF